MDAELQAEFQKIHEKLDELLDLAGDNMHDIHQLRELLTPKEEKPATET